MNAYVVSYMCIFVQEVETMLIDSNNTGGVEGGGAAAVDVEEWGAEHGECTDQSCSNETEFKAWTQIVT